jgi:hypothetical protein
MSESGADRSYSDHVYRVLLLAYPKEYRREYGPQMEQAFRDLRREALRRGGGIGLARLWVRVGLDLASSAVVERSEDKEIATRDHMYRPAVGFALAAALILVTVGVLGGEGDPEVMSLWVLPLIIIGAIAYTVTNTHSTAYRWAIRVALAAAFILFWMVGGVGVLGPDDEHPADLMYIGVLAVGIIGAIIARFQPHGMARALFATALAQMLVPVIALIAGMHRSPISSNIIGILGLLILNGFFVALFLGSAWLFRNAAREQPPAGAGP